MFTALLALVQCLCAWFEAWTAVDCCLIARLAASGETFSPKRRQILPAGGSKVKSRSTLHICFFRQVQTSFNEQQDQ
jgi:hypothetical protein